MRDFELTPRPGDAPGEYLLTIQPCWCSWNGPYGGAVMGAALESMELAAGRPLAAAMVQFQTPAKQEIDLVLKPEVPVASRSISQARVTATQNGATVLTATGTLLAQAPGATTARSFPKIPGPDESIPRKFLKPVPGGISDTLDVRDAEVASPIMRIWVRCPGHAGRPASVGLLCAVADHPPYGVTRLRGGSWYGVTLDSSLRVVTPPGGYDGGAWMVADMTMDTFGAEFCFATTHVWAADGTLLAIATQTMRLKEFAAK